ncbi:MAG: O-acetyl-ADP-ribose deacetylase [Candidatus Saganbacteria bacterium]|nr:O-acetyl-ADP-ribose deacetylase [Candidatus Saganbacteria bacterium]
MVLRHVINYTIDVKISEGRELVLLEGDITEQKVDAIVNAANSSLMGGGGVDGAIHRAGGPKILEECKAYVAKHGRLPTGQAMITTGGDLPARHVIHTVGPVYRERQGVAGRSRDEQGKLLSSCYLESLKLAAEKGLRTVAFPSISTGAYRYPLNEAAPIAVKAVKDFLAQVSSVGEVRFVLFNKETYEAYVNAAGA